ncbi:XtrA/YqaO family protein [Sinobaca sp. H24]
MCSDRRPKLKELPEFGETKIVIHQWKVKRVRQDDGEEF